MFAWQVDDVLSLRLKMTSTHGNEIFISSEMVITVWKDRTNWNSIWKLLILKMRWIAVMTAKNDVKIKNWRMFTGVLIFTSSEFRFTAWEQWDNKETIWNFSVLKSRWCAVLTAKNDVEMGKCRQFTGMVITASLDYKP